MHKRRREGSQQRTNDLELELLLDELGAHLGKSSLEEPPGLQQEDHLHMVREERLKTACICMTCKS